MISVTKPLDYELVPSGVIYLTVMAKDGGNPALNSTVPVTVEVIVSTDPRRRPSTENCRMLQWLFPSTCTKSNMKSITNINGFYEQICHTHKNGFFII